MAKSAAVATSNIIPLNQNIAPPEVDDEMRRMYAEETGAGVSMRPEDRLLPFILILQKGSPEVNEQDPKYIPGAKPGMFLMRGSPPVEHLWVQPLVCQEKFVEWATPRGSGMLARYNELPPGFSEVKRKNQVIKWQREGSELIDTRYQYVNILENDGAVTPAVLTFTGTGHSKWKDWNMQMGKKQASPGVTAPSYSNLYKIGTQWTKNNMGDWFAFSILESRWILTSEKTLVMMGKTLFKQIKAGEAEAEADASAPAANEVEAEEIPF